MSDNIIVLSDRTKELSRSTGTTPFVLDGAATGFSSFGDSYASGDAVFYAATDGTDYEVGSGQYLPDGSSNSLTRFPFRSTNSNNVVSFADGIKEVYVTYPGKYSVFTASGLGPFQEPKASGLAFWGSSQILCHDHNLVWNPSGDRLGISQADPEYAIDIGGGKSYSQIRASGFLDGGSGILFSGVAGSYSGGRQLEPFLRNQVDNTTGTDAVIALSGLVDQRLLFVKQVKGTVFAGPVSGCVSAGCSPDYPTFRYLTQADMPTLQYIAQYNDANPNVNGAIALYKSSGVAKYDNLFKFDDDSNRLGVNTASPNATLDVFGDVKISGAITSYLVTTSGKMNHLLFGETEDQTWNVAIGDVNVGGASTKSIYVGSNAGHESADTVTNQIGIGKRTGGDTASNDRCIFVGDEAGYTNKSSTRLIGIGANAAFHSTGCNYTEFIGGYAGFNASGLDYSLGIGWEALRAARFCDHSHAIGYRAGYDAEELNYSEAIGYQAGYKASGDRNIFIGDNAGYKASGDHNVFIGSGAGFQLNTGSNNLEIVTSGTLSSETSMKNLSYKININNVIHGDSSTKRLVVGNVSGVDFTPNATLEVKPQNSTDVVSIVQGTTSQSADLAQWRDVASVPLVKIEAASGAIVTSGTIYANDSIETSGTISASGGILLNDLVPNATAGRLYNDGGTLKWAGANVDTAGSNTFKLHDGKDARGVDTITNGQTVVISGISGIVTAYRPDMNLLTVSPHGLSGVIDTIVDNVSGWVSGTIGALPGGYVDWKISDGTDAGDTIVSHEVVNISGASGINTFWDSALNRLEITASGLSGVLQPQIDALGDGGGTVTAGSGITLVNGEINLDINGSGQLEHLIFNGDQIRIGRDAGTDLNADGAEYGFGEGSFWNIIGYQAGYEATGISNVEMIGYQAGYQAKDARSSTIIGQLAGKSSSGILGGTLLGPNAGNSSIFDSNANPILIGGAGSVGWIGRGVIGIGVNAGTSSTGVSYSFLVGYRAGYQATGISHSNFIGFEAGYAASGSSHTNIIGNEAGRLVKECANSNILGNTAGYEAVHCYSTNMIGSGAGYAASGCSRTSMIGTEAGFRASGCDYSEMFGDQAGSYASGCLATTMIGSGAGYQASGNNYGNIIGYEAGKSARNNNYTNMMGYRAGWKSLQGRGNNIIGEDAGIASSGSSHSTMIGTYAGQGSQSSFVSDMIGYQAGASASGMVESFMVGSSAGQSASGCQYTTILGTWAGRYAYDVDSTNIIGYGAGQYANDCENSIFIGNSAGAYATGVGYSINIGHNAGYGRKSICSLILKTSATTSNGGASWADLDEYGVFDIAGIINGVSMDAGTNPANRKLRLGAPPDAISDLSNICTSIKPIQPTDVTLKLDRAAVQSASLLQSVNPGAATIDIVDKDGYLTIPVVTLVDHLAGSVHTGSPASVANEVTKSNGRIAVHNIGGTEYLIVCIGTTWYHTAELTAF